jgi:hypothetical protein
MNVHLKYGWMNFVAIDITYYLCCFAYFFNPRNVIELGKVLRHFILTYKA